MTTLPGVMRLVNRSRLRPGFEWTYNRSRYMLLVLILIPCRSSGRRSRLACGPSFEGRLYAEVFHRRDERAGQLGERRI